MCWRPLRVLLRKPSGLSCEIVSDLYPKSFSHDWHVQPSCQRPNRIPPERREFSPGGDTQARIRLSSKPYKHTALDNRQSTQASHRISTRFPQWETGGWRTGEHASEIKPRPKKLKDVIPGRAERPARNLLEPGHASKRRATVWVFRLASA